MSKSPGATASEQNGTFECKFCQAFAEADEEVRSLNEKKLTTPPEYTRERRTWKFRATEVYNGCQVHFGFPEALLKLNVDLNAMDYSIKKHTGVQLSAGSEVVLLQNFYGGNWILRAPQLLLLNDLSQNPGIPLEQPLDHFIDPALILKWKRDCNKYHGSKCQYKSTRIRRLLSFLIDTKQMCLVEPADGMEYVVLSYVWDQALMLKTARAHNDLVRQDQSLERFGDQIPTTIMDSIKLVPSLEERYLWIDSLCII